MASDIALSQAVRQNLLSLQNTADLMSRTQTRLATGNKVNSALDNPINFFTASGLNARAGELNNLQDSMSNAISTIEAADKGLTSITKMVEQMQATVRQAMQVTTEDVSYTGAAAPAVGTVIANGESVVLEVEIDGTAVLLDAYVNDTGADQTLTAQDVVDGINDAARLATDNGQYVRASLDDAGMVEITAVGGRSLSIVASDGATGTTTAGDNTNEFILGALPAAGAEPANTQLDGTGNLDILRTEANLKRLEFAEQYNELREQLNDLAQDASFNGVNLLQGDDLKVVFNELTGAQQSKLEIDGEFVDTESLGVGKAHLWGGSYGGYNPDPLSIDFQSDSATGGLEDALGQLTGSLDNLRSMAAKLGSNLSVVQIRSNFTNDMVNTLQTGAAKL
ncbi:MAG: hypothetical protein AAF321_01035, partial [Pseudomonadota bacterium]